MADKFRTVFTIPVTLAPGEQPTHTKLNSISAQSRNGLAILERAVGDLWNQSGDSVTSSFPNRIVNIARAMGDQSLLDARLPLPNFTGTSSVRIRELIDPSAGKSEITLSFLPVNDATLASSVQALKNSGSSFYTGSSVARSSLISDTVWHVDTTSGKIYLGRALHLTLNAGLYIEYNVAAADFPSDAATSSSFSIIPHQSQLDWKGLKISSISAGKYFLTLPFRRPEISPSGLGKIPTDAGNSASVGSPSVIRYWGPPTSGYSFTSGVSDTVFYRYSLPQPVLEMFNTPVAGTLIPSGTIYLWDTTSNTIIEGVTLKIPESPMTLFSSQVPWVIQAEGSTLDALFSGYTSSSSSEADTDYKSRFAVICVGSSLAEAVNELRTELAEGNAGLGFRRRPSHKDLTDTQPKRDANRHPTNFPTTFLDGDDHPHLLSRLGSKASASSSLQRDRYNNGILGDLLILSTGSSGNYQDLTSNSNSIYFGSHSSVSPRVYSSPQLLVTAPSGPARNALVVESASLNVYDIIAFDKNGSALRYVVDSLAVIDTSDRARGEVFAGRLALNATTQSLSTFTGTVNSTRYIDINANLSNSFSFKGGDLTLVGTAADTSAVVVGGASNANTYLRLYNNRLDFGTVANDDSIVFDDSTNTFSLRADHVANPTTSVDDARLAVGTLRATTSTVEFGGTASVGPDDNIVFDDFSNTFYFNAENLDTNSKIVAGTITASTGGFLESATENVFLVPGPPTFVDSSNSKDPRWAPAGTSTDEENTITWQNAGGTSTSNDLWAFLITGLPKACKITGVQIKGFLSTIVDGSNTFLRCSLADNVSAGGSSLIASTTEESTSFGSSGEKTFTITFTSFPTGVTYDNSSPYYVVFGIRHTGVAAYQGIFAIHSIRVSITRTRL
jgi:hypothetical protein